VPNPEDDPAKDTAGQTDDGAGGGAVPEERDDPRRHGDKLQEAIRPKSGRQRDVDGPDT
jgi:hypothetical protein